MDRRTKILGGLFGVVLAYVLLTNVVYPQWIEPQLKIEDRMAERQEEHDRLYEIVEKVDEAARRYKTLVARVGSFDIGAVETDIRARLNGLIEKHKLQGANVSPTRPTEDRKTGLQRMVINITATGKLKGVMEFLKDVTELPQLVRVGNAAISPASDSRQESQDRMNLRVPLEVMVLPQQRRIVGLMDEKDLVQPESYPRHAGLDYSLIWMNKPFTEPIPVRVDAGRAVTKKQGEPLRLKASGSGGDGDYKYEWSPIEHLDDPTSPEPTVDTSAAFTQTYAVKVTDGYGETATGQVAVTIREERKPLVPPVETIAQTVPQEPPGPQRWKDGKYMQVCMTLIGSSDAGEASELMISNNKSKQSEYYGVGAEFDGGELVSVQPRGGVVRRKDRYFIYPIGGWLDQDLRAEDAVVFDEYPELKAAADQHRAQVEAKQDADRPVAEAAPSAAEAGEKDKTVEPPGEKSPDVAAGPADQAAESREGAAGHAAPDGKEEAGQPKPGGEPRVAPGLKPDARRNPPNVRRTPTKGKVPQRPPMGKPEEEP